ncbi:MAG: aminodeoxychorismate synthase component I [Deltaproteobacteria bacterium]
MDSFLINRPFPDNFLQRLLAYLARRQHYILLENNRITPDNRCSYLFLEPEAQLVLRKGDDPTEFFAAIETWQGRGFYLAGWLAYEFGYLLEPALHPLLQDCEQDELARLWCYKAPLTHDHLHAVTPVPQAWPQDQAEHDFSHRLKNLHVLDQQEDYLSRIARIKSYIAAGDTYQVNYTTGLAFDFEGSPEGLYGTLRSNQRVCYAAMLKDGSRSILSLSPELFFRISDGEITVRPMKGTAHRAGSAAGDEALKSFLKNDLKNRSENVMIVDLLRNDLGRICLRPSVRTVSLFDVESYETLHQMTSTIRGRLDGQFSWQRLFAALFPCGSVTGAPKIRTMEIIRELESRPRGVYTGAIGFIAPDGDAVFNVPIRTVAIDGNKGGMGIGSGIVFDSDPEQEWQECLLKGRFLSNPQEPFQLIETLFWQHDKGFWLLEGHLDRLRNSAVRLQFACDLEKVKKSLADEVGRHGSQAGSGSGRRVRVLLAKDGNLTVSSVACPLPKIDLLPPLLDPAKLPLVAISTKKVQSDQFELYHKTTLRKLYDEERQQAVQKGFVEILFVNENNQLTEGSISNLFVRQHDCYLTPPLACGLLDGVFRRYLMANSPLPVKEQILTPADLEGADAIYIGNSVRGLMQVALRSSPLIGKG